MSLLVKVMKESAALSPVATTTPVRSATKSRVQHAAAALPAPAVLEMNASNTSVVEPGSNQETEGEVPLLTECIHLLN